MTREVTLVHEVQHNFPPDNPLIETNGYDSIKDTFLKMLREVFSRHKKYTYVPDKERGWGFPDLDKTKIVIWEEYALDTLFLPAITISIGSVRNHEMSFNQSWGQVNYKTNSIGQVEVDSLGHPIPIYYEFAGAWDISFQITLNAADPITRDVLTDFIKIHVMHVYRDWLYTRGIHVRSIGVGGEDAVEWGNNKIYKTTTSVEIMTEWTHRIPIKGDVLDRIAYTIGTPIQHSALVAEGIVGEGVINTENSTLRKPAPLSEADTFAYIENKRPTNVMNTIAYNTQTNSYQILPIWWVFIINNLDEQMLQTRYSLTRLADLTVANWMDILANVSSPAHMGIPTVLSNLNAAITEIGIRLNVDPLGDLSGLTDPIYNEIKELIAIRDSLENGYRESVTRYSPISGVG